MRVEQSKVDYLEVGVESEHLLTASPFIFKTVPLTKKKMKKAKSLVL